jgi:single-strand DNA-binding protein
MNDTFITFHGWAGSDVRHRIAKDVSVATVRVAATPRLKKDGEWVDGETTWYTVTAWRTLADHLRDSIRKGDPVIVHGRFRTESWQPEEGPTSTTLHVEASLVGHDLTRGITHFIKAPRPDRAVPGEEDGPGDFQDGPAQNRDDVDTNELGAAHAAA